MVLCTLTFQREFSVHKFELLKVSLGPQGVKLKQRKRTLFLCTLVKICTKAIYKTKQ